MVRTVKKPAQRRQEIVAASRKLFLEQGYEKTSMQEVITFLGIAKGTAYHYFKSKEELLEAVVEEMVTDYVTMVQKALDECQGNAIEKMRTLITVGNVASQEQKNLDDLHRSDNKKIHLCLLAVTISKLAPLYEKVIAEGCKEGVFHVEHPLESAEILLAGIQFVIDSGCYPWDEQALIRRRKAIPRLIENQLQAPKQSFNFLEV